MQQQLVARLNEAKKAKKMTLRQLADASGLTQGTVNKIMSGELLSVKPDKLQRLAAALGVTVEWLCSGAADPKNGTWGEKNSPSPNASAPNDYLGLVKVACISPAVKVANCAFNTREIIAGVKKAAARGASIVLLPELCVTGYSCADLFFQDALRTAALDSLRTLCRELADGPLCIVGLPIAGDDGRMYNAAAVLYGGEVLGVIPKKNLPNYGEFMEKRHFCAYDGDNTVVHLFGRAVPFGVRLLFVNRLHRDVRLAVELCEDVWVANSPSIAHTAAGANAIFNLSASNETVAKADYRKRMIEMASAKCNNAYVYCSCGMDESTSATVFSAHDLICEDGACLAESAPFGAGYAEAAIDFDFIENERARIDREDIPAGYTTVEYSQPLPFCTRFYDPIPFVPPSERRRDTCEQALTILAYGLKKRLEHIRAGKLVIGISGGSDSTLALLVCKRALALSGRPASDIEAVTMPCFGTSKRTLNNSLALIEAVGATLRQIDISAAVTQHLKDIGHDFSPDTVFENAQARERTQVLMDIANATNGLVIGTGDMSEAALGWSTFNGDQMSMYSAIASVPKTLVKVLLAHLEQSADAPIAAVLHDIIGTPVSPELLPTDKQGNIAQLTESVIGPYELHDYFLFMLMRKGFSPRKVYCLAQVSFEGRYDGATILKWLKFFVRRFFTQQFKRSCTPDSVRLGSVDLSKYSLRMPSDADPACWLAELDALDA